MSTEQQSRNYDSISPSAKTLLLLKGLTDIPYAREAATLISLPEKYVPDFSSRDLTVWARVLHFENRYKGINSLLEELHAKNILELSSGFSFRGLNAVQNQDIYYIDTDLPELIHTKQAFIADLQDEQTVPKGILEILPLNALDEDAFADIVAHFPAGEITIVNEGLLMYLDVEEKKKLCGIIRETLQQRGGCWITADIYIKGQGLGTLKLKDDNLTQFLEQHKVEENKFESFEAAEAFFNSEGFVIDKEAEQQYADTTALKYFMQSLGEEQKANMGKAQKIQATWRLRLA